MPDALQKAWYWPGLGLCTYTFMYSMYAEEAGSILQSRRNRLRCLLAVFWWAGFMSWFVWGPEVGVMGRSGAWSKSWDARAAEHTWYLTGSSNQTREVVRFTVPVALGGHGAQHGPLSSTPPPLPPPNSSFSGSIFTSLKHTHTAKVAWQSFGSAQLSGVRAIAVICTILRFRSGVLSEVLQFIQCVCCTRIILDSGEILNNVYAQGWKHKKP